MKAIEITAESKATTPNELPTELLGTHQHLQTSSSDIFPTIDGYEILEVIGRGGMGRVFKARHRTLDRIVAIKTLIDAGDEMLVARFQAESQAVARLQHPNIAQVFETGHIHGRPFLVLEYLEGGTLAQQLAGIPRSPENAARLVETLARAVEYSHEQGILHRDLKPANILLTADGTPKITDFGLAKRIDENSKITRTGEVLGTPSYMAPEQASGVTTQIGPLADIYSLGAILYELVTGRPPFHGPDAMQTLMMVLTMDPVPPSRMQPKLPRDLETICLKCLEKSPRRRYASARMLADDLQRFLSGQPIVARPVPWWERVAKWAKRRPAAAALIVVLSASIIALAAGLVHIQSTNANLVKSIGETDLANQRLQASLEETRKSLAVAGNAIDGMLVDLADELAPTPQSDDLRRRALEKARQLYEGLVSIRPTNRAARSQAADAMGKLGSIYNDLGRLDDASGVYRKALDLHRKLQEEEPESPDHRRGCANSLHNLAIVEQKRGKMDQAEANARAALAEIQPLIKHGEPVTLQVASAIHNTLALTLRANQKPSDAAIEHEVALALRKQWLARDPNSNDAKIALASSLSNGATMIIRARPGDAVIALKEAEKLLEGTTSPRQRFFLGQFQANRAVAYELLKKDKDAEASHALAIKSLDALVADYSGVPGYRFLLAKEHLNLARFYWERQRNLEALPKAQIASQMLERLVAEHRENQQYQDQAEICRKVIGFIEEDLAEAKKKAP